MNFNKHIILIGGMPGSGKSSLASLFELLGYSLVDDPSDKIKMIKFIEHNDALSVFSTKDVVTAFQDFVGQIEFDKDIGDAAAYKALAKMKSDNEAARLLIRMIIAIGSSDGNFDVDEKKIAGKIARELGLNPAEFELL